jgi:hypothetical protein
MAPDWLIGVDCVPLQQKALGSVFINKAVLGQDIASALQKKPSRHYFRNCPFAHHTDTQTILHSLTVQFVWNPVQPVQQHPFALEASTRNCQQQHPATMVTAFL